MIEQINLNSEKIKELCNSIVCLKVSLTIICRKKGCNCCFIDPICSQIFFCMK